MNYQSLRKSFRVVPENSQPKTFNKAQRQCSDIFRKISETKAFTSMELMIAIGVLSVFAAIAFQMLHKSRYKAMEITAMHDLNTFAKGQQEYYLNNDSFAGNPGESIRNDGFPSDFHLANFKPSLNIIIKIISGDPSDPYSESDPIIAESRHAGSPDVFEYNFKSKELKKR